MRRREIASPSIPSRQTFPGSPDAPPRNISLDPTGQCSMSATAGETLSGAHRPRCVPCRWFLPSLRIGCPDIRRTAETLSGAPPSGTPDLSIRPVPLTDQAVYPHGGGTGRGPGVAARAPSCAMSLNPHSLHSRATDEGGTPTRRGGHRSPQERPTGSPTESDETARGMRYQPVSSSSAGGGRVPPGPSSMMIATSEVYS